MAEYQRNKIYDMLLQSNDDNLVKKDESPNENIIYHLYNDGNITSQKGGWAYGDRSEFIIMSTINKNINLDINKFNHKSSNYNNNNITYGYIITTIQNAKFIRAEMLKLVDLIIKE
jgi:hypothetical protein